MAATARLSRRLCAAAVASRISGPNVAVPSRAVQESALIGASSVNPLDVLVIGGGATGSGVALDAVTRGLRVGLVERDDFSSGTSSRSTKLIHGGVRYLEKAVFNLDYGQLKLVFHALEERKQVIENAPHLCHALPCMTPCFDWFEVVYYWMGLKMYDLVAGPRLLHLSRYYSAQESSELFPTLARNARVTNLVYFNCYDPYCISKCTRQEFDTYAKDGRVVFMLPWLGRTVAGTTDSNTTITLLPEPHEDEIQFILDAISDYLMLSVGRRTDVLSAWSEYPGLVTITGGKWTTYRSMAEDAVNAAIKSGKLSPTSNCLTHNLRLIGGDGWDPASFTVLAQQYVRMKKTHSGKVVPGVMDTAAAKHLSHAYGTLAERVAAIAQNENLGKRLAHGYPFLEAEHKWDRSRKKQEFQKATEFLETFKSSKNAQFHDGKHT
ncbi:hypothetical protein SLA2020_367430 [Shorea laevis]